MSCKQCHESKPIKRKDAFCSEVCKQDNMNTIIKSILSGKLSRENDEKEANGFWDLSREIALIQGIDYSQEMQEEIYNNLWLLFEETAKTVRQDERDTINAFLARASKMI